MILLRNIDVFDYEMFEQLDVEGMIFSEGLDVDFVIRGL